MRIVLHTHEFNIKQGGPCTKRMNSFVTQFFENGHEVVILTGSHNKKNEIEGINKKYKIIYCPTLGLGKKRTIYRFLEHISFAISSFFVGLFRLKKTDFVITTSPPPFSSITGYFIAKLKKAKLVYDVRDIWPDVALEMGSFDKKSIYYKVFNFIANFMYKHADYISTVTPRKVEKIKKYCKNDDKVWYIANGFDDNFLDFSIDKNLIDEYKLKEKFSVVYTGNVGLAQNLDAMIELAKKNKENDNLQFLIFGNGAYKEKLQKKIDESNLENITINDKLDYEKMYTILKYSKLSFVSLKNNKMIDSVPTKMFDALGVGCPVLLLASGDSADILKESYLGESAADFDMLCEKFDYIYKNYDNYVKNADQAIKYVLDNYSRKKIATHFVKKIENVKANLIER